jgi:hypothetical protein
MDILLEQLVYGSFPFWDRGYDVLARSPSCRADWVADVLAACRRFGEAPAGVTPSSALFALPLPSGPWAVVGVEPQGVDDRGRPGALAFHALLIEPRDYRKAGSNPFAFAGALRRDWSAETTLDAAFWTVEDLSTPPPTDLRARRSAEALSKGRRVALESAIPIDRLAREVWSSLPDSIRRKASVATWAFGNANRFDLVALPRMAGVELDRSYVDPTSIDADPSSTPTDQSDHGSPGDLEGSGVRLRTPATALARLPRWAIAVGVLVGLVGVGLAWRAPDHPPSSEPPTDPRSATPIEPGPTLGPETRARIVAGLEALADRFEVGGSNDPGALMARISAQVHYRGPTLTPAELARLATESDPDRDRALGWHERIKTTFAEDRPLPDDFARLPLARQLDRLAWSFHLDPSTGPEATPGALLEALSREGPVRPTPLAARYPALSDYARFLGKLPRIEK